MEGFGYCWVVKGGVYEIFNGIGFFFLFYDCLVDMNDFCGMFIKVVNI